MQLHNKLYFSKHQEELLVNDRATSDDKPKIIFKNIKIQTSHQVSEPLTKCYEASTFLLM